MMIRYVFFSMNHFENFVFHPHTQEVPTTSRRKRRRPNEAEFSGSSGEVSSADLHQVGFYCVILCCEFCTHSYLQEPVKKRVCDKEATSVRQKKQHLCSVCGKVLSSAQKLKRHERSVHLKEKPFPCSYCDKIFSQRENCSTHERAVHQKLKPFACSFCVKSFSLRTNADLHEKAVHMQEKPHQCSLCDKSFSQRGEALHHERTVHRGEKPHPCSFCDEKFSTRSDMSKHEETRHLKVTPFRCTRCKQTFFTQPGYLLRHVRAKHIDIQPAVGLHRLEFIDRSCIVDISDVIDVQFSVGTTACATQS